MKNNIKKSFYIIFYYFKKKVFILFYIKLIIFKIFISSNLNKIIFKF